MQQSEINDGGPAFPTEPKFNRDGETMHFYAGHYGMTLRDYFAAKAMHAEMTTTFSDLTPQAAEAFLEAAIEARRTVEDHLAFTAYLIADAMLKARQS